MKVITVSLFLKIGAQKCLNNIFLDEFISNVCRITYKTLEQFQKYKDKADLKTVISIILINNKNQLHSGTKQDKDEIKSEILSKVIEKIQLLEQMYQKNVLKKHYYGKKYIETEDFETNIELTHSMKLYLKWLQDNSQHTQGNVADLIKIISIIKNRDIGHHVNIDSNTIIKDFSEFYNLTFGSRSHKKGLLDSEKNIQLSWKQLLDNSTKLNAVFYDQNYISAHNKVVYTSSNSPLIDALKNRLQSHCQYFMNSAEKNQHTLYSQVFLPALLDIGIVQSFYSMKKQKLIYLPSLSSKCFSLTSVIIPAINKTWKIRPNIIKFDINTKITLRDAQIDESAFAYLIKKHYSKYRHEQIGFNQDDTSQKKYLLLISDVSFDIQAITKFIISAWEFESKKILKLMDYYA